MMAPSKRHPPILIAISFQALNRAGTATRARECHCCVLRGRGLCFLELSGGERDRHHVNRVRCVRSHAHGRVDRVWSPARSVVPRCASSGPGTLCRFKEVLRDVMSEKGFLGVEITHDTRPTYGNRQHLTLKFTIVEGKRSRPAPPLLSPAQRCMR